MRLSTLLICSAILALVGCSEPTQVSKRAEADEKVQEYVFSQNRQTGICVASRKLGMETGTAFYVPCTPRVLAAINGTSTVSPVTETVR